MEMAAVVGFSSPVRGTKKEKEKKKELQSLELQQRHERNKVNVTPIERSA
jgi:hypothetical protein